MPFMMEKERGENRQNLADIYVSALSAFCMYEAGACGPPFKERGPGAVRKRKEIAKCSEDDIEEPQKPETRYNAPHRRDRKSVV